MSDLADSDNEENLEEEEEEEEEVVSDKKGLQKEDKNKELEVAELEAEDLDADELDPDDLDFDEQEADELELELGEVEPPVSSKKIISGNIVEGEHDIEYSDMTHDLADPSQITPVNSDIESEDDDYLQKIDDELHNNYVKKFHPECFTSNAVEIEKLTRITRNAAGIIIDENHKTNPFLTKYEQTKILGQRTKQLNFGDTPYISIPKDIIDGYLIAQLELKEKMIPVIIRRPLPGGKSEYWKLSDLELIY
jgi:DNA-directed RNA polymerases I, II, and III subunit RPABC2